MSYGLERRDGIVDQALRARRQPSVGSRRCGLGRVHIVGSRYDRAPSAVVPVVDFFRKVLAGEAEGLLLVLRSSSVTGMQRNRWL